MALTSLFYFSLLLVFYTYIGYGILLWLLVQIRELFRPKRQSVVPGELPEVTLFIAAYNEEEMVEEKMANCLALDYPAERLRILWVTDGSTDLTNEKLKAYPGVEVHFQPERRGKTAAINRGMTFVKSPVVLFTDANTLINPAALKEMVKAFTDPKTGCVAGEKRIAVKEKDTASSGGRCLLAV